MNNHRTDNSYFTEKVALRADNLPETDPLSVLELYTGNGLLWDRVRAATGRTINILRVDKDGSRSGLYLKGDNRKFRFNYAAFHVVDMDAYGVHFVQLERFFAAKPPPGAAVFVTFIQSGMGRLPFGLLSALGYPKSMVVRCPTLFYANGQKKFFAYLAARGVKHIRYYTDSSRRKTYLYFST